MASSLSGAWLPLPLRALHYGANTVNDKLLDQLPASKSKALIITGNSLATKTPLIKQVEQLLGDKHAHTFSGIAQHAPVAAIDEAAQLVLDDDAIDTVISIGGGSPIDSAKVVKSRVLDKSKNRQQLTHICIPTTLSAAECTALGGYTQEDGTKALVGRRELGVDVVLYDASFARHTPLKLWLATGMRALDHAVETIFNPSASEAPCKAMAIHAASELFKLLPQAKDNGLTDDNLIIKSLLAAYTSLGFLGTGLKGGLGLSHSLGYALGSPYGIPHGETSCITLSHVVGFKAGRSEQDAAQLARLLPGFGGTPSGNAVDDAHAVAQKIQSLVQRLGLQQSLADRGVGRDQVRIVTERATKQKEGELFDAVRQLVETLWDVPTANL